MYDKEIDKMIANSSEKRMSFNENQSHRPCYNEGEVVLKTYDKLTEIMKKDSLIKIMNTIYSLLTMVVQIRQYIISRILLRMITMLNIFHSVETLAKKLQ